MTNTGDLGAKYVPVMNMMGVIVVMMMDVIVVMIQ